jgi:hypothetical protein
MAKTVFGLGIAVYVTCVLLAAATPAGVYVDGMNVASKSAGIALALTGTFMIKAGLTGGARSG